MLAKTGILTQDGLQAGEGSGGCRRERCCGSVWILGFDGARSIGADVGGGLYRYRRQNRFQRNEFPIFPELTG